MARRNKKSAHYVNNAEFSQAVVDYVTTVNEAKNEEKQIPKVPDYVAQCCLLYTSPSPRDTALSRMPSSA